MDIMLQRINKLIGNKRGAKKDLADFLGINQNAITGWLSGRISSYQKYAPQIAEFYGVSLDWLSGNSDKKEKPTTNKDDELTQLQSDIMDAVKLLSEDRQQMILAQIKAISPK